MTNTTYKVRYINAEGDRRLGHVKATCHREATVKAKRFIIRGGALLTVEAI